MTDKCREEFEKYIIKTFPKSPLSYFKNGKYDGQRDNTDWKMWQAAWEASRQCMTTRDI